MNVLAYACDPVSWCGLLGLQQSVLATLKTNQDAVTGIFYYEGLRVPLFKSTFTTKNVTFPVTPGNHLFLKWGFNFINLSTSTITYKRTINRLIELYNSKGEIIASVGVNANALSGVLPALKNGIFSWSATQTLKASALETTQSRLFNGGLTSQTAVYAFDRDFALEYHIDPDNSANSYFAVYAGSELVAKLSGSDLTDNVDNRVASIGFFDNYDTSGTNTRGWGLKYVIATDETNFALIPVMLKPLALTSAVDFTGTVSNIQETLQDLNYLSCSAEAGRYIEFTLQDARRSLSSVTPLGGNSLVKLDIWFYGRYVQTGGVSATFTISLIDSTATVIATSDVVVAANEDNTLFQTKVGLTISNLVQKYPAILNGTVRIALKEL